MFAVYPRTRVVRSVGRSGNEVKSVKTGIHPEYHRAVVTCACGNTFETGSVKEHLRVEICSACHPFFTGKQKFVDTGGRVDRFRKKYKIEAK